ncbi:hypothetical protein HQ585_08620 [candidate division KSB1 bacterium]|nr:hypothetical protein [candidate division KSB1 bacterium]
MNKFTLIFIMLSIAGYAFSQQTQEIIPVCYIASWGGLGSGQSEFKAPEDLAVDPSGCLYVADTGNQRIQKLDPSGNYLTEIGGFGWDAEQFDRPVSVWAGNGLDVFVADHGNHRIQRFDKDLHFIGDFNSSWDAPEYLKFAYPLDAVLSSQGELFCLDGGNRRVLKLDITGNPQISFGDYDSGEGRLIRPQRMMLSRIGNVYVSDEEGAQVMVFDPLGNFLHSFGKDILMKPGDMAEFGENGVLIADASAKRVFRFNKPGFPAGSFELPPITGQQFKEPVAVAVWKNRIFVLDKTRCVIDCFELIPLKR